MIAPVSSRLLSRALLRGAALLALACGAAACDKPTPEECRKAMVHMQELLGTASSSNSPGDLEADVRQCTAGSTKKSIQCAINAKTKQELLACDFYKGAPPGAPGSGGSAAGSAGSAK